MSRGTAEEQVARNREIWRDRTEGYTWAEIGERHGISARRAQEVVQEYREQDPVDPASRTEAMVEVLELLDRAIEQYAELIEETKHPAVKLGAINGKLKAVERRIAVEQSMGLLPHSLSLIQSQEFALFLGDALHETIHRLKIEAPPEVHESLDDVLLKMEVGAEAWRRHQRYPRIQGAFAAKQAQRKIAEEKRAIERSQTDGPKTKRNGDSREVDT